MLLFMNPFRVYDNFVIYIFVKITYNFVILNITCKYLYIFLR